jgi:SAM-dependent methyltransferase
VSAVPGNVDLETVHGFGREWSTFDQSTVSEEELRRQFERYFAVFPWDELPAEAVGFDAGCGSGRWGRLVAPRVGLLHCLDANEAAVEVARSNLRDQPNCVLHVANVDAMPFPAASMDFGYSLGVLHHVPDTLQAVRACVEKLKPGAPLLLYLYYALDDRPLWFRSLFRMVDLTRRVVSRLPHRAKLAVSTAIAVLAYLPLSRLAQLAERLGRDVDTFPLSSYRDKSFYSIRTDALDRFGTRLEHRFTREQVIDVMRTAGCERVVVSPHAPYWCAVGWRPAHP